MKTPFGSEILFLTAGLGEENFANASRRVSAQIALLSPSSTVLNLTNENLESICPMVSKIYGSQLKSSVRGFGYMAWKSEITFRAVRGDFGPYKYVVWVDSGCEVVSNFMSRLTFTRWLLLARMRGYVFFKLTTPEEFYTKKDLFAHFANLSPNDKSGQLQTTFFILNTSKMLDFSTLWHSKCIENLKNVDESKSSEGEIKGFIAHRHDQSVFSLSAKSLGFTKTIRTLPNGTRGKLKYAFPVWAARNRSGGTLNSRCKTK